MGDSDTPPKELMQYAAKCSNEPNCNTQAIKPEFCHSYTYTKQDLIDGIDVGDVKKCGVTIKPLGCYYQEDNERETIKTGCVSDLNEADPKADMKICKDYECSQQFTFMTCLEHAETFGPHLQYDDVKIKLCNGVDSCFTYIHNLTYYERGCQSDMLRMNSDRCESAKDMCVACDDKLGCNRMGLDFMPIVSNPIDDEDDEDFHSAESNDSTKNDSPAGTDPDLSNDLDNKSGENEKPNENGNDEQGNQGNTDEAVDIIAEPEETDASNEPNELVKPGIVEDPVSEDETNDTSSPTGPNDLLISNGPNGPNDNAEPSTGLSQASVIAIILSAILVVILVAVLIYKRSSIGGIGNCGLCKKSQVANDESAA